MGAIDDALEANRRYVESGFEYTERPEKTRLALVLCMDARIHPWAAFGLKRGHAHVIRNAGGRVADALRSLAISQLLVGTDEVAIVHHTECAMLTFTDEGLRTRLKDDLGVIADDVAFLPFTDLEESVRDDITVYNQSPLVRHDIPVRGFIYDVSTGALTEVK